MATIYDAFKLKEKLSQYVPYDAKEQVQYKRVIRFLDTYGSSCFDRDLLQGHCTGSAWVLSADYLQVLLVYHKKLQKWLQPGGHADGQGNLCDVAQRELVEETGVFPLTPSPCSIFDIDVHTIPADRIFPKHYHYDIRFLFLADEADALQLSDESIAITWVPLKYIDQYTTESSILRMRQKSQDVELMASYDIVRK